ncbi:MAG: hypothetical protein CL693_04265 [Cellvibrionaceae bacterium]|nr:hypothetical protein [Cellvibrionaceae bacterium]|tara:strand:+ start:263 stop:580 length:318 start_codon:yes stop_codon:yes gene_type:complete
MPEVAQVYMYDHSAGMLMRDTGRYYFVYDPSYVERGGRALSQSLPLQLEVFESEILFPYFDGLVSEGWLRKIQSQHQRIDDSDHFRLLINNGLNLAGAIRIEPTT